MCFNHPLLLLLACMAGACVTLEGPGLVPYAAPAVEVPPHVTDQHLLQAAADNAHALGWTVVIMDRARSRLEALAPEQNNLGRRTRERWMFTACGQRLMVERRVEGAVNANHWESSSHVRTDYQYGRENDQLDRVTRLAARVVERQLALAPIQ